MTVTNDSGRNIKLSTKKQNIPTHTHTKRKNLTTTDRNNTSSLLFSFLAMYARPVRLSLFISCLSVVHSLTATVPNGVRKDIWFFCARRRNVQLWPAAIALTLSSLKNSQTISIALFLSFSLCYFQDWIYLNDFSLQIGDLLLFELVFRRWSLQKREILATSFYSLRISFVGRLQLFTLIKPHLAITHTHKWKDDG